MKAKDLKVGEHYAEKRNRWNAVQVELLSTEPHIWNGQLREFVPGKDPCRPQLYLVRWVNDNNGDKATYVVQARHLTATWAYHVAEREAANARAEAVRKANEELRARAQEVNNPKLRELAERAREKSCSPGLIDALSMASGLDSSLRHHISLDDLLRLAR